MSTCRVFVVSFVDSIDGLRFAATCPGCRWDGPDRGNHDMARIDGQFHTTQGDGE